MRILVTGGLGAVGRALVTDLKKAGHEVFVIDIDPHYHNENYARIDVSEFRQLERLWTGGGWSSGYMNTPRKFDFVFHLAAEFGRWNGEDYYETVWKTNAIGTKNILRMQEREGFKAVYFSTSEVYGDHNDLMVESVMDNTEIKQLNDYALSKWVNEQQVINSALMNGTESVRVRLFNTYGPGEYYTPYRSMICLFVYRALHNIPYTVYKNHTRTSIYISDVTRTLSKIAENFKAGEVYNIGGTDYHDIESVSNKILKYIGKDDSLVTYRESEVMTTRSKRVDSSKAERDLGHTVTVGLDEGIANTIRWMKEVYQVR
ncbi:MAG: NAD(P)-dependent oxidoreductase [Ignavibacteriales bacterium]|nr:MAG: NAD(P)-dependent oxidoreductase [Ignavibacteriaceae bacterium]MBW7874299.1 NAD(P)-dependent oxidoreductase [Ignavibacteria bacterium]MCZ2143220.1 NAD(P)-dependent oxidoreductase [Ignavibacteriales bacterium]OQY73107.1 MAG: nucleoside-diphosphate sugar epimerase [Ignavibacteriales bacterium UTCHB3]MBV6444100.1 dTDP-glucose 4,6-dehydratase [Ignavibacteriaceae bacterium]